MHIVNEDVKVDIDGGKRIRLNLGAGGADPTGRYSVDHLPLTGVAIVADLNKPLSLIPDNAASEVFTSHTLEHITDLIPLMRELHRITFDGGKVEIIVPHFSSTLSYSDPTHVRFFDYTRCTISWPIKIKLLRATFQIITPIFVFALKELRYDFVNGGHEYATILRR